MRATVIHGPGDVRLEDAVRHDGDVPVAERPQRLDLALADCDDGVDAPRRNAREHPLVRAGRYEPPVCSDRHVLVQHVTRPGATGDARGPHDHFEWHPWALALPLHRSPFGFARVMDAIDPYPFLNKACRGSRVSLPERASRPLEG